MSKTLSGYACCSNDKQELAAQRVALLELGVDPKRIYSDHGLMGTHRLRPGLDQALAAVRRGDTRVVPKLDRLARAKGKLRGKQPKLCEKQQKELRKMRDTGKYLISDLAELFSISRPTVDRSLARTVQ